MKISLKPVEERHLTTPYFISSSMLRAFSLISPQLVYFAVNNLVTYGSAILLTNMGGAYDNSQLAASMIRIIAMLAASALLVVSFVKEKLLILPKKNNKKVLSYILTCILGLSAAAFFNVILTKAGLTEYRSEYAEAADARFLLPIWGGVLIYGIITPVTEELVHRGLIYNRARRYFNLPLAMIISPLIFGVAHGNLAQMIYAFVLGIAICAVYEKMGAFIYPVLFHASANSFIYIAMKTESIKKYVSSVAGCVVMGIVACVSMYFILRMQPEESIDKG